MKKIFILSLFFLSTLAVSAESKIEVLFDKYKTHKEVTYVHMSNLMMILGSMFVDDKDARDLITNINSMSVMTVESYNNSDICSQVSEDVVNLQTSEYELMTLIKENGSDVRIIAKSKDGIFSDLIIFVEEKTSSVLVHLKGKLEKEDFDDYVKLYGSEQ